MNVANYEIAYSVTVVYFMSFLSSIIRSSVNAA